MPVLHDGLVRLRGLAERKLLPKPKPVTEVPVGKGGRGPKKTDKPKRGWFGKLLDTLVAWWKKLLEAAEKKHP